MVRTRSFLSVMVHFEQNGTVKEVRVPWSGVRALTILPLLIIYTIIIIM